jgi:hypothetical protein
VASAQHVFRTREEEDEEGRKADDTRTDPSRVCALYTLVVVTQCTNNPQPVVVGYDDGYDDDDGRYNWYRGMEYGDRWNTSINVFFYGGMQSHKDERYSYQVQVVQTGSSSGESGEGR